MSESKWLKHTGNGRVFPRTDLLARRPDMVPCDKEGRPILGQSSLPEGVYSVEQLQRMSSEELEAVLGRKAPEAAEGSGDGPPPPPPLPATPEELGAMTKDQLLDLAASCALEGVKHTNRKDEIITALTAVLWPADPAE